MAESKPGRVFDVAKPGKSAPTPSAKPILVTNRPVLQDPMVTATTSEDETGSNEEHRLVVTTHPKIQPLHTKEELKPGKPGAKKSILLTEADESEAADESATSASSDIVDKTAMAEQPEPDTESTQEPADKKPEPADEPKEAASPDSTSEPEPESTEAAADAEPATETSAEFASHDELKDVKTEPNEHEAELAAQKEQQRAEELQQMALSRKYYLPINQIERRRNKRAVWMGIFIVVLLGLAWADVALDAGLVHIPGVKPVTHLFSN